MFKHVARYIVGLTFVFSGFVKGIDPLGSMYKFTDYFNAFHLSWLNGLALPLGILLAAIEFGIGIALIFKLYSKAVAWLALAFMSFFLILTFILALSNPVSDCGCFGDAITLTNWQTFFKNVFLMGLTLIIFINRKKLSPKNGPVLSVGMSIITMVFYFYLVNYSYNHLPIIDFRPYKVGVNIPEAMQVPEDAPKVIYKNSFYYKNKKTGKIKEFSDKNYPWQDTIHWEFVRMGEPKLIQEGYTPPIHDFYIETVEGEDVKDFFLYDEGYTFIMVAYDLDKTNKETMDAVNAIASYASENNMQFIGLTSSLSNEIKDFKKETGADFEFFNGDEITLKTIIRSNPGLILLKKGTILRKWSGNNIPSIESLKLDFDW